MDQTQQHKRAIEKQIVDISLKAYSEGKIERGTLKEIADTTVAGMKKINNEEDLVSFLDSISKSWSFLSIVAINEKNLYSQKVDSELYSGVLTLAQSGQIDKAIELAKSATAN